VILAPAVFFTGCILSPLRAYDPRRISAGSVCLDVPLVRQPDRQTCGLCVAEMLSKYYRLPLADEDRELVRRRAAEEGGTPARLLKEVLVRSGFRVVIFRGESLDGETPTSIAYHLRKKRPLVVMVSPRGRRDHYMVVSGRDAANDMVIFEDPGEGRVMCRGWVFRRVWARSDFLVLLAVPGARSPAGGATRSGEGRAASE
jgi:ABC-type bacteriocin/lantibiotic exporter with double-glycine peptidase domain